MKQTPEKFNKWGCIVTTLHQVSFDFDVEFQREVETYYSDDLDELVDAHQSKARNTHTSVDYFIQSIQRLPTLVRTPVDSMGRTKEQHDELVIAEQHRLYLKLKAQFEP